MSMSQHPVQPRSSAGTMPLTPFVLLGAVWGAIALAWLAWAAGRIAAAVSGATPGPGFGSDFVARLVQADWTGLFPGVHPAVVAVVFVLLLAVAAAPVTAGFVVWQRRRTQAGDPLPSLARPREVADLTPAGVTKRAVQLRPSLQGVPPKDIAPIDTGLALGSMKLPGNRIGPLLRASWEDGIIALMGPRAWKTTAVAVPLLLDSPGFVVATSNRADLWATTHAARAQLGRIWLFDAQGITRTKQTFWVDILGPIRTVEDATLAAANFVQSIRAGKNSDDMWSSGAEGLITNLLLAAACSDGTMNDVQGWLADSTEDEPVTLLERHGFAQAARSLRGRLHGAPETRDGIYETARTAAKCLEDPVIMAWITPQPGLQRLPADDLADTRDTLYLLTKDGAGSAGPIVATIADQVLRLAVLRAEGHGGRLDPPATAILDEAANCPLGNLPALYSHYGGRGICLVTILQSYSQGVSVWGEHKMDAMWSAATVKLIGAGSDGFRFAEDVSRLVGEHDVATLSLSRDGSGHLSRQVSVRRQRILGPEDIRALKRGTALLLASGARPAMLQLNPWFSEPRAAQLKAATEESIALITDAAERQRLVDDLNNGRPPRAWHTYVPTGGEPPRQADHAPEPVTDALSGPGGTEPARADSPAAAPSTVPTFRGPTRRTP